MGKHIFADNKLYTYVSVYMQKEVVVLLVFQIIICPLLSVVQPRAKNNMPIAQ